jgi:gliding motility-associated-like protein
VVKVFPFPEAIGDADKYLANVSNALINFTDNSIGAITREWTFAPNQFSNLENAFYTFNDTGSYEVTLKVNNSYGCVAFDTLIILVETSNKFNVPNAFTPNTGGGNGGTYDPNSFSNEVFFPRMELVDQYHLLIFNRWGEIVFESNDVNIGWDGYYKDRLSPQDAYVWKIEATFEDGTQLFKVGDLTLLR